MGFSTNKSNLELFFGKMKKIISKNYRKGNYETVARLCSAYATIAYNSNQFYADKEIENQLKNIAKKIIRHENAYLENGDKLILFYDGFGLNSRGLVQIYLKALCKIGRVIYIGPLSCKNKIPDIVSLLKENGSYIEYLDDKISYIDRTIQLNDIVQKYQAKDMFFYSLPNDVVGYMVFACYEGIFNRYQINLTDHAFWLGTDIMDYCIEFRNYGSTISHLYRGIPKEKLIVLPFYPEINENMCFQGYPEGICEKDKFVFSGGALYKTIGGNNNYYKMVSQLLIKHSDLKFWYAGSGNKSRINELIKTFPGRVILTDERSDFVEIIKRCVLYLSTYPICGGLMFQYAAKVGKVPLTLKYDNITDDFLLNQDRIEIEYDSIDGLLLEADKLLSDEKYLADRNALMKSCVIDENEFCDELKNALKLHKTKHKVIIKNMELTKLIEEYQSRMTSVEINKLLVQKEQMYLVRYFPVRMMIGIICKVFNKILK